MFDIFQWKSVYRISGCTVDIYYHYFPKSGIAFVGNFSNMEYINFTHRMAVLSLFFHHLHLHLTTSYMETHKTEMSLYLESGPTKDVAQFNAKIRIDWGWFKLKQKRFCETFSYSLMGYDSHSRDAPHEITSSCVNFMHIMHMQIACERAQIRVGNNGQWALPFSILIK